MKRFNKTAIAIALTGALALGVTPDVTAQETPADPAQEAPAGIPVTLQEGDLVYDQNGNLVGSYSNYPEGRAVLKETDKVYGQGGKDVTADRLASTGNLDGAPADNQAPEGQGDAPQFAGTATEIKKGQKVVDASGNVVFEATEDGTVYLKEGEKVVDADAAGVPAGSSNVDKETLKKVLIGLGATAGVLTIAGIVYKVVNDAQGNPVLVPADREDQTPTEADKQKTDELVAEHGDEIAAQADTENGDNAAGTDAGRGVNAETGNNTIAKGLVGLLLASIMGAAIFAFGRRRVV